MGINVNKQELLKILTDFYDLTGVRIAVFDEYGQEVLAYPQNICALCMQNRKDAAFNECCNKSNSNAFSRSAQMDGVYIYKCHFGLTEAVSAIKGEGKLIGYIMYGQLIEEEKNIINANNNMSAQQNQNTLYQNIPKMSKNKITAAAAIMEICARYLLQNKLISFTYAAIGKRIKDYLNINLTNPIDIKTIENEFKISHMTIYKIFKSEEGCGAIQYLNSLRLKTAETLLLNSSKTLQTIAEECGLSDANYLSRAFKKSKGLSPSAYKKQQGKK